FTTGVRSDPQINRDTSAGKRAPLDVLVPPPWPAMDAGRFAERPRRQGGEWHFPRRSKALPPDQIDWHKNHSRRPAWLNDRVNDRRRRLADFQQCHLTMMGEYSSPDRFQPANQRFWSQRRVETVVQNCRHYIRLGNRQVTNGSKWDRGETTFR